MQELRDNAEKISAKNGNDSRSARIFTVMANDMQASEEAEVKAVMLAYYSAFNRVNFFELRALWLPDENTELLLPGFDKAVSFSCTCSIVLLVVLIG